MRAFLAIFQRELTGYFITPVAYVFMAVFLVAAGAFTFEFGQLYERGQADLMPFFTWHPWLYLFLIPAVTMRLWAEERRTGTLELLITLPVTPLQMVLGKFFAAWVFTIASLCLTFPVWITVSVLGNPDHGVIIAGYLGSILMAGGYLAIGACISATTRNQVIAFVLSLVTCFVFTISGLPVIVNVFEGWLPQVLVNLLATFSFLRNFSDISTGVLEVRSLLYFATLIGLWLFLNTLMLSNRNRT